MSGGRLVVLDRAGRDVKRFSLAEGLATLGNDPACDIRIMLPTVSPHHATVVVHANQTVVRNVCEGETLVNGHCVSVAALRHGDVISIGGRHLRWDYTDPTATRPQAPEPALFVPRRAGRGRGRRSAPGAPGPAPPLRRALELSHRASMPGSAGGKQVAIVQPQRRDTSEQIDKNPSRTPVQANKRPRTPKSDLDTSVSDADNEKAKRKSSARVSPKTTMSNLQNTTKATLWIESRKTSPRKSTKTQTPVPALSKPRRVTASAKKSTPLRLTVLKRAQSAQKMKVTKIEAPLKIDHTKQAAILLMTGHSAHKARAARPRDSSNTSAATVTILEITDSDGRNSSLRSSNVSLRSGKYSINSPAPLSPKKSALKDPSAKKGTKKSESIKFDLSNLENHSQEDLLMVTDTTKQSCIGDSESDDDITLRYSESSGVQSPSPRRSIHSRSSRMLEKTLGSTVNVSPTSRTVTPDSKARRSSRGTMLIQKGLNETQTLSYSRRSTKSVSDKTNTSVASAYRTRTLSPRTPRNDLESYSIVDLVSIETDDSAQSTSVYDSAGSTDNTAFGTPQTSAGRRTRSTIDPTLLGSSTPYVKTKKSLTPRSHSSPNTSSKTSVNASQNTTRSSVGSRRSKSLSTPENTEDTKKHISVNSTRISRASRSRSRINESDLLLLDDDDDSPRTSKRISKASKSLSCSSVNNTTKATPVNSPAQNEGTSTPENRYSPEEASTPVLSIQSLLDSSQSSLASQKSMRVGRASHNAKRKTIGVLTEPKTRVGAKSKSMNFSARKTRLRLSSDSVEASNKTYDGNEDGEIVTPKSAVKLIQEGVKNKHSTAKKPQSKRSIIDDLNESDIVKQLFNSPVKRKLSQSMTEFSRKQLFDDDDIVRVKRPTRNTIALTGRTPDNSLLDSTDAYTPELFVSPISTPTNSPNLDGIKLLFAKTTPENDLRNVRGVKTLLRTPRTRRSIKNDLTNVSGVKNIFAKSPKNRLSDVRVKEVFAPSPKNDLRRVSGVKSLFQRKQKSPRNELDDVRGVKKLFKAKSPANDLRNVSGVKRTLRNHSPRNDLTDVRGVRRLFRQEKQRRDLNDVSGVEELFNESNQSQKDSERLFDQLVGKPLIRAVYSKTFSTKSAQKTRGRKSKALHASLDVITNNVESWLEQELNKRLHKATDEASTSKTANKSKVNVSRELQKLITDTVEGTAPIRTSRVRNSTVVRSNESDCKKSALEVYSAHTLPIKKRSLVEASTEKENSRANILPIKKRAVVHSTPVKGKVNVTMNASVLGRVSPIAAIDETRQIEQDTSIRYNQQEKEIIEARPKSRRGTKTNKTANLETSKALEFVKPSPKNTRGQAQVTSQVKHATHTALKLSPAKGKASPAKTESGLVITKTSPVKTRAFPTKTKASSAKTKAIQANKASPAKKISSINAKPASPVQPKATRSRKHDALALETNTKKRGEKLVVAKKSPVMSPQPKLSRKRKEPETLLSPKSSPKKTRATRKQVEKPQTPKTTRARVHKATVVFSKPSPQLKPRAISRQLIVASEPQNPRKTRQTVILKEEPEPPTKSHTQRKSKKIKVVEESASKTRGRKTVTSESRDSTETEQPEVKPKRGRKVAEEPVKKTRNTKQVSPVAESRQAKNTRKRNKQEEAVVEPKTKTRGKKIETQESEPSEPTTRGRRAKQDVTTEVNTRKRKTTAPDSEIPPKLSKPKDTERGRKKAEPKATNTRNKSAVKESQAQVEEAPVKATRGRKAAAVAPAKAEEPEQKPVRGRKANIENVPANQGTGKRKRATAADLSPAEEPSKKQRGGRKAGVALSAHNTRRAALAEVSKPAGRSRRR